MSSAAKVKNGAVSVTPGIFGGTKVSTSPIIFDMIGASLRNLTLESDGAMRIEFWKSTNSDDPANQANLDSGVDTVADYSNIIWEFIGTQSYAEPGLHRVEGGTLSQLNGARYAKLDKTHGAKLRKIHAYGI